MLALVGLGYWGPNLLRNFIKLDVIRYAFDLRKDIIAQYVDNKAYSFITFGTDWSVCLDDPMVKCVAIATNPESHYHIAREALLHGKHVFIEKPMTTTVADAEELVRIAKDSDLRLMVGHTFLYSLEIRKIKELLDLGVLGDLLYMQSSRLNLGLFQTVGVISDLAPHDISIFNYLNSNAKVKSVISNSYGFINKRIDEVASVTLEYDNGVVCSMNLNWLYPVKERKLVVVGTKRMLIYDMLAKEKIKVFDRGVKPHSPKSYGEYLLSYRHGDSWSPNVQVLEPLYLECAHFIECVENNVRPLTDGENGLEVVKILDMILKNTRQNGGVLENCYD